MALVPTCDRCGKSNAQTVSVLGKDLCCECVACLREWLAITPPSESVGGMHARFELARSLASKHGEFSAASVAHAELGRMATPEERRSVSYSLNHLKRKGLLVSVRHGFYGLRKDAAQ